MNDRTVFAWTLAAAVTVVAVSALVGDITVYDAKVDRDLAESAISGEPFPSNVARTPGGYLLLLPWLVADGPALIAGALTMSVVCLALIAVAINRLAESRAAVAVIAVLVVGTPFHDAIFSGGVFMPYAAMILWGWVWHDRRPWLASVLWGITGVARLWPFLLAFAVRDRRIVYGMAGTAGLLTVTGLLLPGVTLDESIGSLFSGGGAFLPSRFNGSLAAWLTPLGPEVAVVAGAAIVLTVWRLGLGRVDDRIAWTLPAAILASPLAWRTYLFVLAPVLLRQTHVGVVAAAAVVFPFMPPRGLVTGVCVLAMYAAWKPSTVVSEVVERDHPVARSASEVRPE